MFYPSLVHTTPPSNPLQPTSFSSEEPSRRSIFSWSSHSLHSVLTLDPSPLFFSLPLTLLHTTGKSQAKLSSSKTFNGLKPFLQAKDISPCFLLPRFSLSPFIFIPNHYTPSSGIIPIAICVPVFLRWQCPCHVQFLSQLHQVWLMMSPYPKAPIQLLLESNDPK